LLRLIFIALVVLHGATASANQPCPKDFNAFARKFESDPSFRSVQVRYPLVYEAQDKNQYPDGQIQRKFLAPSDVAAMQEALFPPMVGEKNAQLGRRISVGPSGAVLELFIPESDSLHFRYTFVRHNSCWALSRVEDLSL